MPIAAIKLSALVSILSGASIAAAGHVEIPVTRHSANEPKYAHQIQHLEARDNHYVGLSNQYYYYKATLEIGTPAQSINILIDTGSSDLWVASPDSGLCERLANCEPLIFDSTKSSTYKANESDAFAISYGDYTYANGLFGQDTVNLGPVTINNANFAIANDTNSTACVFGIGPMNSEATVRHWNRTTHDLSPEYYNLPEQMKLQGDISANAYSLWLNDVHSSEGGILFGGVDKGKYCGDLTVIPMIPFFPDEPEIILNSAYQPFVNLNKVGVYNKDNMATEIFSGSLPVILDSGTSFMILPPGLVEQMAIATNATYDDDAGLICDCDQGDNLGFYFDFMGAEIFAPYTNFISPLSYFTAAVDGIDGSKYPGKCLLPLSGTRGAIILGDTFLRNAYIVYDNDRSEVAIAQAYVNSADSDISDIISSIPGATTAASYYASNLATVESYPTAMEFTSTITTPGCLAATATSSSAISSASASASSSAISSASASASAISSASASASAISSASASSNSSSAATSSNGYNSTSATSASASTTAAPVSLTTISGHTYTVDVTSVITECTRCEESTTTETTYTTTDSCSESATASATTTSTTATATTTESCTDSTATATTTESCTESTASDTTTYTTATDMTTESCTDSTATESSSTTSTMATGSTTESTEGVTSITNTVTLTSTIPSTSTSPAVESSIPSVSVVENSGNSLKSSVFGSIAAILYLMAI